MPLTVNMLVRFRGIRVAIAWVRICRVLAWIVGGERAARWAVAGVHRLVRAELVKGGGGG